MHLPDFYKVLGISENASAAEVKTAFRRLALIYHPDKNPGDKEAIEIFSAIHEAYAVISDTEKRKEYDLKRPGKRKAIFPGLPVRTIVDRNKLKVTVNKRVVMLGEPIQVLITIFVNKNKIRVSGLQRFDIVEGPVINSLFPPGPDSPEMEIAYVIKAKDAGYIEIGPASFISEGTKYCSESIFIKVNPPLDLVRFRPVSRIEKFQSATVSALIVFYSFLIGYNIYQFKMIPFIGNFDALPQSAKPLSLGDVRLATGDSPYDNFYGSSKYDNASLNRVVFHNGKLHDAVVLLADLQSDETVRNNYIRSDDDFIMHHIPDGNYYLKVLFGNDWNNTLRISNNKEIIGGFNRNARYEVFHQEINIIQMQHSRSGDTLGYKVYEITLYPVQEGNAESLSSEAKEFFN